MEYIVKLLYKANRTRKIDDKSLNDTFTPEISTKKNLDGILSINLYHGDYNNTELDGENNFYQVNFHAETPVVEDIQTQLINLRQAVANPIITDFRFYSQDKQPKSAKVLAEMVQRAEAYAKVTFLEIIEQALLIYREELNNNVDSEIRDTQ